MYHKALAAFVLLRNAKLFKTVVFLSFYNLIKKPIAPIQEQEQSNND